MLMFQGGQAEQTLSEDNYSWLVRIVLGEGLQKGIYTEDDKVAYIKAWSQPGALTGGLKLLPRQPRRTAVAGWDGRPRQFRHRPRETHRQRSHTGNLGRDRHSAAGPKPGRTRTICARLAIQRIPDGSHWVVHEKPAEVTRTSGHLSPSHNLGPSAGMVTHWAAAFTAKTVRLVGYREVAVFRASALAENPELEKGMERCAVIHSLSALQ